MRLKEVNFSGISNKTLLGKFLRLPLRFIPANTKMTIVQGKLKGKTWVIGTGDHGCWLGSYEYEQQSCFSEMVTEGSVVFDIGAHAGFYTLLASVLTGINGRVFAFEPVPQNLVYLREHLQLNHITNVTVVEAAVSDCCGETLFDEGPGSTLGHISPQGKMKVRTVSLDELISGGEVPAPDFMKIDVEGAEVSVLAGAKAILGDAHPKVFLSTHGFDKQQQCCDLLGSLGYKLQAIGNESLEQSSEILAFKKN